MFAKILIKLFGKKIVEGALEKYGLSKTKVVAVIGVALYAIESLGPVFGWDIKIEPGLKEALLAAGLWTLKDGQGPTQS